MALRIVLIFCVKVPYLRSSSIYQETVKVLDAVLNYSGFSIMCRVAYALGVRGVNIFSQVNAFRFDFEKILRDPNCSIVSTLEVLGVS